MIFVTLDRQNRPLAVGLFRNVDGIDHLLFRRHWYSIHANWRLKGWEGVGRTQAEYMGWLVIQQASDGPAIHVRRGDVMRSHESNSVFGYAQSIQIASDFNR